MASSQHHSRVDLAEIKSQIIRRIGPERSQRYFFVLNKFLSYKVSKSEFDRSCSLAIGRENLSLHNQFLRSIIKNAHQSRIPPPRIQSTLKSDTIPSHPSQVWSNGDILPPSPRKIRSNHRRIKDRFSPLGSNGKIDPITRLPVENGHHLPAKLPPKVQRQQKGSISIEEEKRRVDFASYDKFEIQAPLGIPFCSASIGGSRYPPPLLLPNNSTFLSNQLNAEICDSENLRKRMEEIAESHGLGGISIDCANLLNNGLDVYLKQLIQSCIDLGGRRSGIDGIRQAKNGNSVSMLDFRVAMELNPRQLGEDWTLLLEKICHRSFEE